MRPASHTGAFSAGLPAAEDDAVVGEDGCTHRGTKKKGETLIACRCLFRLGMLQSVWTGCALMEITKAQREDYRSSATRSVGNKRRTFLLASCWVSKASPGGPLIAIQTFRSPGQ